MFLGPLYRAITDRSIALYHALFSHSGFKHAVSYYEFLAKLSEMKSPEPEVLPNNTFKDKPIPITAIEEHTLPRGQKLYLFQGGFSSIAKLLKDNKYQVELVNPANSRVPGGAVRRAQGTLDEHLSRCSILQDKVRHSLYEKVKENKNKNEKAQQLGALNRFYSLSDNYVELAKNKQLNNLNWWQRASMLYQSVLAERALIHSNAAKIDPGEYERNSNVLMWVPSEQNTMEPMVVDISHIVAPDLRWMTGEPRRYKLFPYIGTTTNKSYEDKVKESLRKVIQNAKENRMIVFPAFGCGAFLGDINNFSNMLISVLQEEDIEKQIDEKNLKISLGLVGEAFKQISTNLQSEKNKSQANVLNKETFSKDVSCALDSKRKAPDAVLRKYQAQQLQRINQQEPVSQSSFEENFNTVHKTYKSRKKRK